jgi:acyl carrier protein
LPTTLERLQQLFIAHFDYDIEELTATTTLENLGLDSLDIIEFIRARPKKGPCNGRE